MPSPTPVESAVRAWRRGPRRAVAGPAVRAASVAAVALGAVALVAAPMPAAAGSPTRAPLQCASGSGFTVRAGDSWYGLARQAGVSVTALVEANGLDESAVIVPGDVLCLPAGTDTPPGWSDRACGGGSAYTVAAGDSWFGIARRAGVRGADVLAANDADASRVLQPGQSICLPAGATLPSGDAPQADGTANDVVAFDALPLQGPCWFGDTWGAPRGAGRRHQGADLITWSGRYVYAVTDGVLTRRAWAQPGLRSGNAWWLTSADGSGTYFFYAHLSDFAPGLEVGSHVEAGEIIGFVGSTGNSSTPHLHFEIHPNGGGPVNPYPSLAAVGGCKTGTGYRQPTGWTPSVEDADG